MTIKSSLTLIAYVYLIKYIVQTYHVCMLYVGMPNKYAIKINSIAFAYHYY